MDNKCAFTVPEGACDSHLHVLDSRFVQNVPPGRTADDYNKIRKELGLSRSVIVTTKNHGTNNDGLLDAIACLGNTKARGVGVVNASVSDAELERLHKGGVRGIRFSVHNAEKAVVTLDMLPPLVERIAKYGWHIQFHMLGKQLLKNKELFFRLQCPIVLDHMGRVSVREGIKDPAFPLILKLIDRGNTWVKLSGAHLNTQLGIPYNDVLPIAVAFVKYAPERLVWGSDWPYMRFHGDKSPDLLLSLNLLKEWIPDEKVRQHILVANPQQLYQFS